MPEGESVESGKARAPAAGETAADILARKGVEPIEPRGLVDWPKGTDAPAFVAFVAPWCKVSREAAPVLAGLAGRFRDRVAFLHVDVDRAPVDVDRLNVRSVPALVLFAREREIARRVGLANEDEYARFAEDALREVPPEGGADAAVAEARDESDEAGEG